MALPFLALNYFDSLYLIVYEIIAIFMLAYKNGKYPLPSYALATEAVLLTMMGLTQLMRYNIATKAIHSKQPKYMIIYMVGSLFVILSFIFELSLQTYVTLWEIITNAVGLLLILFELIAGAWVLKVMQRKKQIR